jgi:hypothetical protein
MQNAANKELLYQNTKNTCFLNAHLLNELPVYPVRNVSTEENILLFLLFTLGRAGSGCFSLDIMTFMMQGIITAPMLYAMEEFPQLHDVVDQGFDNPANVDLVSYYFVSRMGDVFFIVHFILPIG